MRSRIILIGVLAAVSSGAWGCGDSGDDAKPGNTAGMGGGGDCPALKACGGDPVGDWTVDDVCVANPGGLFEATVNQPDCKNALKETGPISATGGYNLTADKKAVSTISVSGSGTFLFNDACVKALGVAQSAASECSKIQTELGKQSGVKSATCTAKAPNCECVVNLTTSLMGMGTYTVADNKLTVNGVAQPFCVEGGKLTIEPTSAGVTAKFTMSKK
jgi:hypothetical protein